MTFSEADKLIMKGYVLHDGGPMPVVAAAQPGVVMDDGEVITRGTIDAHKIDWSRVVAFKSLDRTMQGAGVVFSHRKIPARQS